MTEFILIIIESFLKFLSAGATIFAAVVAIYGINSWRREFKGKRNIELAEEVLELFYKAEDAITAIRSPLGYTSEGQRVIERLKTDGKESNISLQMAVLQERYEDRQETFQKLYTLRYRFIAHFGKDKARPFDDLKAIINSIFISAKMLFILEKSKDNASKEERIRDLEAKVEWGDEEKETITSKVKEIVKQIEEICCNIIESG